MITRLRQDDVAEVERRGDVRGMAVIGGRPSGRASITSSHQSTNDSSARMPPRRTRYWCRSRSCSLAGFGKSRRWIPRYTSSRVACSARCRSISLQYDAWVAERRTTELHPEPIPQYGGIGRLGQPAGEFGPARRGHPVDLLVRAAVLGDLGVRDPAGLVHPAQHPVDLLVRGRPEVADRPVEPPGQLVPGPGPLAQRDQDRVLQRHTRQRTYATRCSAPECMTDHTRSGRKGSRSQPVPENAGRSLGEWLQTPAIADRRHHGPPGPPDQDDVARDRYPVRPDHRRRQARLGGGAQRRPAVPGLPRSRGRRRLQGLGPAGSRRRPPRSRSC